MASRLSTALRALEHRNFKLFFFGQSISVIGTWMTRVATSWLVFQLTHSAWMLGVVSFAGQIPTFLLAPFAGVWVDRWNKHRVLVWTQSLAMVQSFALAALTLAHRINVWEILSLSVMQGLINAFDMPGRQSFLVHMVEGRDDLSSAIALNSSIVNLARLLGPSIAGVLIAVAGEGWCFFADGVSYIAVIASLLMMTVVHEARSGRQAPSLLRELSEGWSYVRGSVPLMAILLLFAVVSLMGIPYMVLMPVFASTVLHGGAHTLGFLMGAAGVGALIAAIALAMRRTVLGLGRIIGISAAIFGAALIAFSFSRNIYLSLALLLFTGFGMVEQMSASNTVIQTLVTDEMRGRVMSYYTMAFVGMAPFGSLLAGGLASHFGAPRTLVFTGSCCIVASLFYFSKLKVIREHIRPRYRELGILPANKDQLDAQVATQ